ncbi:MAG: HNH endonuclease [Lachnospiraceae bacterium]|nr:HNH endonuclease [Lachnospiraceae bacterium]
MYLHIIDELNRFLNFINVPGVPLNPNAFQGILVKKLSNQNIIKDKRRINAGENASTVNQTHLDITGQQGMLFFFETLNDTTTAFQNIDIDLYDNNLKYLYANDAAIPQSDSNGNTYFVRSSTTVPPQLFPFDLMLHSTAYKKYGHTGNQVQINIPDSDEMFTQLQHCAFQNDALVMLRYDYLRYVALIIPYELCNNLYTLTNTHGNQNVNFVALNPTYNQALAHQIQHETITRDVAYDDVAATTLQNTLNNNPGAGIDIERIVKTRVSQGSFRRLLLLERHQCNLCDITTTSVLGASHIKEWAVSSREERIDSNNGLLLCANHDALFDRHQISFNPNSGDICISASIDAEQRESLNLSDTFNLSMTDRMKSYMQEHYQKFISKENT